MQQTKNPFVAVTQCDKQNKSLSQLLQKIANFNVKLKITKSYEGKLVPYLAIILRNGQNCCVEKIVFRSLELIFDGSSSRSAAASFCAKWGSKQGIGPLMWLLTLVTHKW